ncbi:MAG: hypothetical protein MUF00_21360, partial [Gemmatimonadaceae bacterium]|nr:hypothetical protein [Gemmatimonadaceae bacterium]
MIAPVRAMLEAWATSEQCAVRLQSARGITVGTTFPDAAQWRAHPLGALGGDQWSLELDASIGVPPARVNALSIAAVALLAADAEGAAAAQELAERYEEIDLLYRVGDLLGSAVRIEDA